MFRHLIWELESMGGKQFAYSIAFSLIPFIIIQRYLHLLTEAVITSATLGQVANTNVEDDKIWKIVEDFSFM
jgi:hypothetical protein